MGITVDTESDPALNLSVEITRREDAPPKASKLGLIISPFLTNSHEIPSFPAKKRKIGAIQ